MSRVDVSRCSLARSVRHRAAVHRQERALIFCATVRDAASAVPRTSRPVRALRCMSGMRSAPAALATRTVIAASSDLPVRQHDPRRVGRLRAHRAASSADRSSAPGSRRPSRPPYASPERRLAPERHPLRPRRAPPPPPRPRRDQPLRTPAGRVATSFSTRSSSLGRPCASGAACQSANASEPAVPPSASSCRRARARG